MVDTYQFIEAHEIIQDVLGGSGLIINKKFNQGDLVVCSRSSLFLIRQSFTWGILRSTKRCLLSAKKTKKFVGKSQKRNK